MIKETFDEIITKSQGIGMIIKKDNFDSVTICGSSKFCDLIAVIKWELEKFGIIATGLHYLPEWYIKNTQQKEGHIPYNTHHLAEHENVAKILDRLHLRKIDKHACVLVVNPDNYIGERTKFEINYAHNIGCKVYYWEVLENLNQIK